MTISVSWEKEWIDNLIGKFKYLPIDKVIAVSKSGFYDSAFDVAIQSKIKLLTPEDALEEDWVRDVKTWMQCLSL